MPAKAKKVDPAVLAQQFESWQQSEEYNSWEELLGKKETFKKSISTTTKDMTRREMQPFLNSLHELVVIMKVPHKSTSYEQVYLRTAFYPQVGIDYMFSADGLEFELHKDCVDIARDTRGAFVDVLNNLDTIRTVEETNFIQVKKDFVKKLTTFEKQYMNHVKKAHDYLMKEVLAVILQPLTDAIDTSMNLYYLENRAHEKRKWFKDPAPEFRLKAVKQKFAEAMEILIKRLREHGPLTYCPDVLTSLSRFEIDTSEHEALKFFVNPVKSGWRKLRSEFKSLHKYGIIVYKQPVQRNKNVVAYLKEVLDAEWYAEQLLGDELKLEQLKLVFDVVCQISLSPLKDKMFNAKPEDEMSRDFEDINCIVAELAVFKALQQMYQAQEDIAKRQEELREAGLEVPEKERTSEASVWSNDKETRYEGIPRVWVWEGYIRDPDKVLWLEAAQVVSQVNLMVQEDICDYIIARYIPRRDVKLEETRPPYLWNKNLMDNRYVEPEDPIFEEDQPKQDDQNKIKFRGYVDPEKAYVDGRVQEVIAWVEKLAINLKVYQKETWNMLVSKVISSLKVQEKPDSGKEDISFEQPENPQNEENPPDEFI